MDGAPGFRVFYDRHRDAIFAYLLASAANREEALDLLQDTFIRAWGRLDEVEAMGANEQRAWLRAVARNATVDQYRRRSVRRAVPLEGMAEPPAAGPGPKRLPTLERAWRRRAMQLPPYLVRCGNRCS